MKVLNLHGIGDLVYEDREMPVPGKGEVLLKVMACGICSSDEARVLKTGTYHFPTVPGHEFAGQVADVGPDTDRSLIGKKASVFPMLPCMECPSCKKQEYATCSNYKYFGSRNDGGYAEYLVVPAWNLVLMDDSVDYKTAALSEPAAVAHHAVDIGGVKQGDHVAVIGTGAIGILIAAFSKLRGADVVVCGRRKQSMEFVESFGFSTVPTNELEQEAAKMTDGNRMDVVFEAVGSNEAMEAAIMSTRTGGTIVATGNPQGDFALPKDVYWKILRWQLHIRGTWNSSFSDTKNDWKEVAALMKEGGFPFEKLITKTFPLSQGKEAFEYLADKSHPKARLMFVMHEEAENQEV